MTPAQHPYAPFVVLAVGGPVLFLWLHRTGRLDRARAWTLVAGLAFFGLTELGRNSFRPFIYEHHPDHPMIANTIGNSLGTLAAVFTVVALAGVGDRTDLRIIAMVVFGLVGYELSNVLFGHPVDLFDVAATLICGVAAVPLYLFIHRQVNRPS